MPLCSTLGRPFQRFLSGQIFVTLQALILQGCRFRHETYPYWEIGLCCSSLSGDSKCGVVLSRLKVPQSIC